VTSPAALAAVGRGEPPEAAPGENVNAPLAPTLSLHVPLSAGSTIDALTCTAAPSGAVTMLTPKPSEPSGLNVASPVTGAALPAPH
jgi:hypothetical protein